MYCRSTFVSPGLLTPCAMAISAFFQASVKQLGTLVYHNSGAPHFRHHIQRIDSTLLGCEYTSIHLPLEGRYGLDKEGFPSVLDRAWSLLDKAGFCSPDEAAEAFTDLPQVRLHVVAMEPCKEYRKFIPEPMNERDTLRTALILGRCTANLYDPFRPTIWTANRLERWVRLYQSGSFYDEDE